MGATGSISKMDFSAEIYNISNSVIIGSNSIKSVEFKLNNVSNIRYAGMLNIGFYDYNNINLISLLNSFYTQNLKLDLNIPTTNSIHQYTFQLGRQFQIQQQFDSSNTSSESASILINVPVTNFIVK